jgi:hypothetical protein
MCIFLANSWHNKTKNYIINQSAADWKGRGSVSSHIGLFTINICIKYEGIFSCSDPHSFLADQVLDLA